jgi:hypothetical protein
MAVKIKKTVLVLAGLAVPAMLGLVWMGHKSRLARAPDPQAVSRVMTEPNGEKTVLIKWAIGTPDNIVTLRQPLGHMSLWAGAMGAWLGSAVDGSAETFSFLALLPDMRPWTKETLEDFTRPGGGNNVEGLVESVVWAGSARREKDFLAVRLEIERQYLVQGTRAPPSITIEAKPDRFGLKRIGPRNIPADINPYTALRDLYYLGETPESSPFFIVCDAEEVRSKEDDPDAVFVPHCEQYLMLPELSAIVKFDYRRVFLPDWREIQSKVERLLLSFHKKPS